MNVRRSLCGGDDHHWKHGLLAGCAGYHTGKLDKKLHAKAVIAGPGITGEVYLYQEYKGASESS